MKPVLYLDVDGVLWDIQQRLKDDPTISVTSDPTTFACGANGLEEFVEYMLEKFEVRWCTTWAMHGVMRDEDLQRLEDHTGIPTDAWAQVKPSLGWVTFKHQNIDWTEFREGREFVWVEDGLLEEELQMLRVFQCLDNYYYTDVFEDADALVKTLAKLKERFGDTLLEDSSMRE